MHDHMEDLTGAYSIVRNYCGVVNNMSKEELVIETDLFPREALVFYTNHNLLLPVEEAAKAKYYTAARGGGQGDYRDGITEKIDNVKQCLTEFPHSKRAVLTVPYSSVFSKDVKHQDTNEAKCLRELHFYIENDDKLHCSGFMRAQAASIFPKNIHFIGSIMHLIGDSIGKEVGSYTHFVTTLTNER